MLNYNTGLGGCVDLMLVRKYWQGGRKPADEAEC